MWVILLVTLCSQNPPPPEVITPPRLLSRVEPVYPEEEFHVGHQARVVLLVTIGVDGAVPDAAVEQSGGGRFDDAALDAVRQWRFSPAMQGGEPLASQIHVAFSFTPPAQQPEPAPAAPAPRRLPDNTPRPPMRTTRLPQPQPAATPPPVPVAMDTLLEGERDEHAPSREVVVRARRVVPARGSSDFVLDQDVLASTPTQDTSSLLQKAPGMVVGRTEGDAVAGRVFLRGFDADHGQDIEFTVDGIPINQPSHIHGQGYADLNFLIPEAVRELRVTEGVYDPRQADFAVAGSAHFDLGVAERGIHLRSSVGSFGTVRQLVLWAPLGEPEETFGAVAIRRTQGFGKNRGGMSGAALGQYVFLAPLGFKATALLSAFGARANFPGVVRTDDVDAGRVGFYDGYNDPSANNQSAFSARVQGAGKLEHRLDGGGLTVAQAWVLYQQFRIRENFTGYRQRSQQRPEWVGRGDLIEQENQDLGLGGRLSFRTPHMHLTDWFHGDFEVGTQLRSDLVTQAQNLIQAPENETWDHRVDATVRGADLGVYGDMNWHFTDYLHLRGGPRANVLYYDIDDRLGNFTPAFQRETHFPGFRRNAMGVAWGPRGTLQFEPASWVQTFLAYGEGYRSPQARQLAEGENAPFSKVRSFEGGVRLLPGGGDRLTITAAAYLTMLSKDLVFDPEEGRVEAIGPTTRKGAVLHLLSRPVEGATASVSVTYVNATLDAPPAATPGNPNPAYTRGQLLPYVPPVVIRSDMGYRRALARIGNHPLMGQLGLGISCVSGRPLPYRQWSAPVATADVSASLRLHYLEFGFDIFNISNARYSAMEFLYVSDWANRDVPSLIPARHTAAGAPRTVLATLGFHL